MSFYYNLNTIPENGVVTTQYIFTRSKCICLLIEFFNYTAKYLLYRHQLRQGFCPGLLVIPPLVKVNNVLQNTASKEDFVDGNVSN